MSAAALRRNRHLAIAFGLSLVAGGIVGQPLPSVASSPAPAAALASTAVTVPPANVLDVDFSRGAPTDGAQALPATVVGTPAYSTDPALERTVASFNGASGIRYPFTDPWNTASPKNIINAVTIECVFRYTGTLPTAANNAMCSGRQGGGYTIDVSGSDIRFIIAGTVVVRVPAKSGVWYHAAATYDGAKATLYLNGTLAGAVDRTGATAAPTGKFWVIGADTNGTGGLEFYGKAAIASARIWSTALTADQVYELSIAALGDQDSGVALTSTVPAAGTRLTKPTRFQVEIENQGAASGWEYTLDGGGITPGQSIGEGLRAGNHTIRITATDLFGRAIDWRVDFTSATIPVPGGTETGQGHGTVTLSATATDPDGGRVTTTFEEATASAATGGFQGVVPVIPSTLGFTYSSGTQFTGQQSGSPSSHDQIPFQRFDVAVPASGEDRRVQWSGVVDPARTATVRAWSAARSAWVEIAESRGNSNGDTVLAGDAPESVVDRSGATPVVHVLVSAEDPFADDLAPRDSSAGGAASKDHFENPADYDFSIVHWSDPQYLTEGATGGSGKWPASVDYPTSSGVQSTQEQEVWAATVTDSMDWIADNAAGRKIAFVANTGDLTNNNFYRTDLTNPDGSPLYPGLSEQVAKEFSFISNAYGPVASSGVPNQVLAGNHDNELGVEIGASSRYSRAFSASSWYGQADDWPAGAEYHAWDETVTSNGTVTRVGSDNQNSYVLFSAGGLDFVAVALSYGVTQAEAAWANSVFQRYRDRNGIISTHGYMGYSTNADGRSSPLADDGNRIYDSVVSANPNIVLVLAGHRHGSGINLKTLESTDSTHKVVELLSDYQTYLVPASTVFDAESCPSCRFRADGAIDVDGDGVVDHTAGEKLIVGSSFLRLLQFNTKNATVSVDSYSPFLDEFGPTKYDPLNRYNGAEENFTVPIDLTSRTTSFQSKALTVVTPNGREIGSATVDSGRPAMVTWGGLVDGVTYAWSATSRNAAGEQLGTVDQYGGVFVYDSSATDSAPPRLYLPTASTVQQNAAFDALAGVSASDNVDGDVTGRIQVVGTIDTTVPGSQTLLYTVSDTSGNTAQTPRTVQVIATPVPVLTATTVAGPNVTATFGKGATLVATVAPASATGIVQFSNGEDVLCQAQVANGTATCAVGILPPPGSYVIGMLYFGDAAHATSEGSLQLTVKPASLAATAKTVAYGKHAKVKVTIGAAAGKRTGTVSLTGAGKPQKAKLTKNTVTFTLPATIKPGKHALRVTYSGDATVAKSTVKLTLTIAKRAGPTPKIAITKKPTSKATGTAKITVKRAATLAAATGKVTVTLKSGKKSKKVTATLKKGSATVRLPKLAKGTWKVTAKYTGNRYYTAKSRGVRVTVR